MELVRARFEDAVLSYADFAEWTVDGVDLDSMTRDEAVLLDSLRADALVALGRVPEAVELTEKCADSLDQFEASERTRAYVLGMHRWLHGRASDACDIWEDYLARQNDMWMLKRQQLCAFLLGDAERMYRCVREIYDRERGSRYFHAIVSFAAEQYGKVDEAEREALEALRVFPGDVWAHHALLHAFLLSKQHDKALQFANVVKEAWVASDRGSLQADLSVIGMPASVTMPTRPLCAFLRTHCVWHLALVYLHKGDLSSMWSLYYLHLWPHQDKYVYSGDAAKDVADAQVILNALGLMIKTALYTGMSQAIRQELTSILAAVDACRVDETHADLLLDVLIVVARRLLKHETRTDLARNFTKSFAGRGGAYYDRLRKGYLAVICKFADIACDETFDLAAVSVIGGSSEQRELVYELLQQQDGLSSLM